MGWRLYITAPPPPRLLQQNSREPGEISPARPR